MEKGKKYVFIKYGYLWVELLISRFVIKKPLKSFGSFEKKIIDWFTRYRSTKLFG